MKKYEKFEGKYEKEKIESEEKQKIDLKLINYFYILFQTLYLFI